MKRAIILMLVATLTGCSDWPFERAIAVDEFLSDEALRADHIAHCRQNPGDLSRTPNCRNAEEAEGKARLKRMNNLLGG